jgi:hypothetical protein
MRCPLNVSLTITFNVVAAGQVQALKIINTKWLPGGKPPS